MLFDARGRVGYDDEYPEEKNPLNLQLLLLWQESPVCAFRLDRTADAVGIIRLMAVPVLEQRKGHGRTAIRLLRLVAREIGLRAIEVGSAPDAVTFYRKQGFRVIDTGWEAPRMRLDL